MSEDIVTRLRCHWIDRGRDPQNPPDPKYPDGIDIDLSEGKKGCSVELPHPTPRCGVWMMECENCGNHAMITTAGRADDPRSVKLKCILQ